MAHAKVLLGRRTMPDGRTAWDMPGGFLNADDRVVAALHRECLREMGLVIEVGEILGAFDDDIGGAHIVSIVYVCRITAGEPRGATSSTECAGSGCTSTSMRPLRRPRKH